MCCFDFIVLGEAAIPAQPGEGALHNPSTREHLETSCRFLNDLDFGVSAKSEFSEPGLKRSCVAAVSPNLSQPAETESPLQEKFGSIPVLQAGGMHADHQDQSQRVYQEMSFSSHDLLACIKAALSGLASHLNALAVNGRSRWGFFFRS